MFTDSSVNSSGVSRLRNAICNTSVSSVVAAFITGGDIPSAAVAHRSSGSVQVTPPVLNSQIGNDTGLSYLVVSLIGRTHWLPSESTFARPIRADEGHHTAIRNLEMKVGAAPAGPLPNSPSFSWTACSPPQAPVLCRTPSARSMA
jgi:hypothetical protein